MFGNVTALVGWIYIGEIQDQKHAAHMLQACGLGFSQVVSPGFLTPTPLADPTEPDDVPRQCAVWEQPAWGHMRALPSDSSPQVPAPTFLQLRLSDNTQNTSRVVGKGTYDTFRAGVDFS